jgi:AP-3 complex subunit delta-1
MRALDLIVAMASPQTLQSLVQHLLSHLAQDAPSSSAQQSLSQVLGGVSDAQIRSRQSTAYRVDVSKRILDMCCNNFYANVEDFEWLLSVFVDLAYLLGRDIGHRIHFQLLDLTVRVKGVRSFAAPTLLKLLQDSLSSTQPHITGSFPRVLEAAVWICGEYSRYVSETTDFVGS